MPFAIFNGNVHQLGIFLLLRCREDQGGVGRRILWFILVDGFGTQSAPTAAEQLSQRHVPAPSAGRPEDSLEKSPGQRSDAGRGRARIPSKWLTGITHNSLAPRVPCQPSKRPRNAQLKTWKIALRPFIFIFYFFFPAWRSPGNVADIPYQSPLADQVS
jgi:hypothetical protein